MPKLNEERKPLNEKEQQEQDEEFQHLQEAIAHNENWAACHTQVRESLRKHGLITVLQTLIHTLKHDAEPELRNPAAAAKLLQRLEVVRECYSIP